MRGNNDSILELIKFPFTSHVESKNRLILRSKITMDILTFIPLNKGHINFSNFLPKCSFVYHIEMVYNLCFGSATGLKDMKFE